MAKKTIAFWVETLAPGAGHWRVIYEGYREAKERGHNAIVLSGTSESATGLFPFESKDIKPLMLPVGDHNYYKQGDMRLPKPDAELQHIYAKQMISILSRHRIGAFITEQQPIANLNRGWFMRPLGEVYDYLEKKSPKPVFGSIARANTLGLKAEHYQGGVTGPEMIVERVKRLDFIAVRGVREITDLADHAEAARHPEVAKKLRYVGYFTPQLGRHEAERSGMVVSAGSNWLSDNPMFYGNAIRAFSQLDDALREGGMRVLLPRDTSEDMVKYLQELAQEAGRDHPGKITVEHNVDSRDFEALLVSASMFILRPGGSAPEAIVAGGNVIVIPQVVDRDSEQMIRAANLAKTGLATLAILEPPKMHENVHEVALGRLSAEEYHASVIHGPGEMARLINSAYRSPPQPKVKITGNGACGLMDIVEQHLASRKYYRGLRL